jgi:hypothetical protein
VILTKTGLSTGRTFGPLGIKHIFSIIRHPSEK